MNRLLAVVIFGFFTLIMGCGVHHEQIVDHPGYRPPGEGDAETLFRERLGKTSITIFPTVVKSFHWSAYDKASRNRIADFLETDNLATVSERDDQVDLSESRAMVQWKLFQESMSLLAAHLKGAPISTEYALLVEYLVAPRKSGEEVVGGIQCYILDSQGHNAFSFLLNSHHRMFNEAELKSQTASDNARADLIDRSTEVVVEALRRQLRPEAAR